MTENAVGDLVTDLPAEAMHDRTHERGALIGRKDRDRVDVQADEDGRVSRRCTLGLRQDVRPAAGAQLAQFGGRIGDLRCQSPIRWIFASVVSYVEAGHSRRAAAAHFRVSPSFVINLMTAFRQRGAVTPKALGGWRHSKLDPHRVFILRRVAEKDDISMPELAGELHAASGVKADPASLSRWLIRNGLSFKKKPSGEPNAIGPTCARRARRGRLNDSPRCGPSRIGWCSSTKQEPTPR